MPRRLFIHRLSRANRRRFRLARTVAVLSAITWLLSAWRSGAGGPPATVRGRAPSASSARMIATAPAGSSAANAGSAQGAAGGAEAGDGGAGAYGVGTATVTFSDSSRPAPARVGTGPRVLVTTLHYPAPGDPSAAAVAGAAPVPGVRFPLIVFAHGFDTTPATYENLLTAWARRGYVVASPTFPGTAAGPGADEGDVANQVVDVAYVISQLRTGTGLGSLASAIDGSRIALAGHSDGGETVAGLGLDSCCVDPRVSAVIVMAGAELPLPSGSYPGVAHTPLLVVQGDADAIDPPASDEQLYADAPPAKWYLDLIGGDHLTPFTDLSGQWAVVPAVTADFLDWKLRDDPGAAGRFAHDGDRPGVSTLVGNG